MPASFFVDDNYYVHLFGEGVYQATANLIEAVRPLLDPAAPENPTEAIVSDAGHSEHRRPERKAGVGANAAGSLSLVKRY
jgi:hypothetical protein